MRCRLDPERKRLGGVAARRAYAEKKPADHSDEKRRDEGGRFQCDPHGVSLCLKTGVPGHRGALCVSPAVGEPLTALSA
jgi:hypothetical protein